MSRGRASMNWLTSQVSSIVGILLASIFPDNRDLSLAGTLAGLALLGTIIVGMLTFTALRFLV